MTRTITRKQNTDQRPTSAQLRKLGPRKNEILKLYEDGGVEAVHKQFGVSRTTLWRLLKKENPQIVTTRRSAFYEDDHATQFLSLAIYSAKRGVGRPVLRREEILETFKISLSQYYRLVKLARKLIEEKNSIVDDYNKYQESINYTPVKL